MPPCLCVCVSVCLCVLGSRLLYYQCGTHALTRLCDVFLDVLPNISTPTRSRPAQSSGTRMFILIPILELRDGRRDDGQGHQLRRRHLASSRPDLETPRSPGHPRPSTVAAISPTQVGFTNPTDAVTASKNKNAQVCIAPIQVRSPGSTQHLSPQQQPYTPPSPHHALKPPPSYSLHITSRHTLRHPPLLHLSPPIPLVLPDQHKPLALGHAMLGVALRRIVVHGLDVAQLLAPPPRRHRRALLLAPRRCRADRRAAVGVRRLARVLRRDGCRGWGGVGEDLEVAGRDEAFFVAGADFDPAGAGCDDGVRVVVVGVSGCQEGYAYCLVLIRRLPGLRPRLARLMPRPQMCTASWLFAPTAAASRSERYPAARLCRPSVGAR